MGEGFPKGFAGVDPSRLRELAKAMRSTQSDLHGLLGQLEGNLRQAGASGSTKAIKDMAGWLAAQPRQLERRAARAEDEGRPWDPNMPLIGGLRVVGPLAFVRRGMLIYRDGPLSKKDQLALADNDIAQFNAAFTLSDPTAQRARLRQLAKVVASHKGDTAYLERLYGQLGDRFAGLGRYLVTHRPPGQTTALNDDDEAILGELGTALLALSKAGQLSPELRKKLTDSTGDMVSTGMLFKWSEGKGDPELVADMTRAALTWSRTHPSYWTRPVNTTFLQPPWYAEFFGGVRAIDPNSPDAKKLFGMYDTGQRQQVNEIDPALTLMQLAARDAESTRNVFHRDSKVDPEYIHDTLSATWGDKGKAAGTLLRQATLPGRENGSGRPPVNEVRARIALEVFKAVNEFHNHRNGYGVPKGWIQHRSPFLTAPDHGVFTESRSRGVLWSPEMMKALGTIGAGYVDVFTQEPSVAPGIDENGNPPSLQLPSEFRAGFLNEVMRDDAASHLMFSAAARMTYAESLDSLLHGGEEDTVGRVGQMYRQLVDARAKVLGDDAAARDAARAQLLAGFRTVLDQASDLIPTNRAPVVGPYLLDATKDVAVDSLLKRFETHYAKAQQEQNKEFRDQIPREYRHILAQAVIDAKLAKGDLSPRRWIERQPSPETANFLDVRGRVRPAVVRVDPEKREHEMDLDSALNGWLDAVARSSEPSARGRVDGLRRTFDNEIYVQLMIY